MDYCPLFLHLSTTSLLPYAATAAGAIILIFYAALVRRSRTSPPLPPGPIGLPILEPQLHSFFAILASTHGPLYSLRLGSKLAFVISSPSLAREVLRDHDANFANRDVPAAARVIAYGGSDIVWNPNGPTWRMLRRICVPEMLSPVSLDAVYHFRRRELRAAVRHLYTVAAEQKPVNVGAEMFLAVLNVITSMLWGGTVEGAEDRSAWGRNFGSWSETSQSFSGCRTSLTARFDLQGIQRKMRFCCRDLMGSLRELLKRRK